MAFNKNKFENSLNSTQHKIEELINKYGSIANIPLSEKEKIIEEQKKNLPIINGIHITNLQDEVQYIHRQLTINNIFFIILAIVFMISYVIK